MGDLVKGTRPGPPGEAGLWCCEECPEWSNLTTVKTQSQGTEWQANARPGNTRNYREFRFFRLYGMA